jgi:hypothetical protein
LSYLQLLMEAAPNWFSKISVEATVVEGECTIIDSSATADRVYAVRIEESGGHIYVRESVPGTRLPSVCYDRHIQPGGYFCLGLDAGRLVEVATSARNWWSSLSEYLRIQAVAAATGRWPRTMELDHGDAGYHHQKALAAAATLGVSEEYELGLIGEPSWTNRLLSRDGKRVLNGRAPCPVGCVDKKGRAILRCDCCSKDSFMELLRSERKRGVTLKKFWEGVRKDKDMVCCQTMIDCPIRDRVTGSA